jgi:hypothetical protein
LRKAHAAVGGAGELDAARPTEAPPADIDVAGPRAEGTGVNGLRQRFVPYLHTAHPTEIMGEGVFTKPLGPALV